VARAEWLVWALVVAAAAAPRIWLAQLCPAYIWSSDSAGYLFPALRWLGGEAWLSDPRRGPLYSGFLAGVIRVAGDLTAAVHVQQALGAVTAIGLAVLLRARFGKRALVPVLLCGVSAGLYGLPVYLGHLIRNETLLFVFTSAAIAGLLLGLDPGARGRLAWLVAAGFFGALVNLTKNVFLPWPLLGLVAVAWPGRRAAAGWVVPAAAFLIGYALPTGGAKVAERAWPGSVGGVSYAGIQLYGRVAQWTVLDGGLHPEIKEAIRPLVLEYRSREKPDNNWVIKRGIIPVIGKTIGDTGERSLDRICRELAVEAIRANPREFAAQAAGDFGDFLFEMGWKEEVPEAKTFPKMAGNLERIAGTHPSMRLECVVPFYRSVEKDRFRDFYRLIKGAVIFEAWPPVLVTSLLLFALFAFDRAGRPFWFAVAGIWFFNLVLLSTVGKPMHRYLMPLVPVMFLAMGAAACRIWLFLAALGGPEPRGCGGVPPPR
jgi:hypothetical protein